jgi:hypothetical protein
VRRPPRWLLVVAAAWFALAGTASGILALVEGWTAISSGLNGCVLMIEGIGTRFPVAPNALGCTQWVDVVSIAVAGLASIVLLVTLAWLTGARRGRNAVPLGAGAAVLVGLQPLFLVAWLIDREYVTGGPIEWAVGIVPLAWSVISAGVALGDWRASRA